jgi:hypothetical protein
MAPREASDIGRIGSLGQSGNCWQTPDGGDGSGRAQRAIATTWDKTLGQCARSQSALCPITGTLSQADEAFRPQNLRGDDVASLSIDTVKELLRRWDSKTGGGVSGGCVAMDGRDSSPSQRRIASVLSVVAMCCGH